MGKDIKLYVNKLVNEFMCNEDLDDNDKIYGYDFMVEDDFRKPSMLNNLERHPKWPFPTNVITWEEALEDKPS